MATVTPQTAGGRSSASADRYSVALAAALYLLLAVVQTWPLCLHLTDRVPHDLGDPLLITYLLNWNANVPPLTERWWHPPFFWPTQNTIVFSDTFVGLAPIVWLLRQLGMNAAGMYNVLFVASFWLPAVSAYLLLHTLTKAWAPSFVGGLAYAFAPYHAAQLSHLQVLFIPAVPLIFLALHRALSGSRPLWLAIAASCWIWQGLVSTYFLLFIPVAVGLWLMWFAGRDLRFWTLTLAAFVLAALVASPVILRYRQSLIEARYLRPLEDVKLLSADVTALGHVPEPLAIRLHGGSDRAPETDIFPGVTIAVLALWSIASGRMSPQPWRRITMFFAVAFVLALIVSLVAALHPVKFSVTGITVSLTRPSKALSIALVALCGALWTSQTVRRARIERSPAGGYAFIAIAVWTLALGPYPAVDGNEVLYRSPYWILLEYVPGFEGLRAVVRIWTIAVLCLAILVGVAMHELLARTGRGRALLIGAVCAVLIAEGWMRELPLKTLPEPRPIPAAAAVVLEVPSGDPYVDTAAMYRSLQHGRPVLNGYSGYEPPAYRQLQKAIAAGDLESIVRYAEGKGLAVVMNPELDAAHPLRAPLTNGHDCAERAGAITCLTKD